MGCFEVADLQENLSRSTAIGGVVIVATFSWEAVRVDPGRVKNAAAIIAMTLTIPATTATRAFVDQPIPHFRHRKFVSRTAGKISRPPDW
jgi:hypothetical protein